MPIDEICTDQLEPQQDDYARLGRAISDWYEVENWLLVILRRLAGIGHDESLSIFSNIRSFRTISAILKDLSKQKMNTEDQKQFSTLLSRFDKLAAKRNVIVHSSWYKNRQDEWCRYLVPASHAEIRKVLSTAPSDQKVRDKHLFTPKKMQGFCKSARDLEYGIMEFWDDWDHRRNPS